MAIQIPKELEPLKQRALEIAKKYYGKPKEEAGALVKEIIEPLFSSGKKLTNNDIYTIVNSVEPVYFDTKGMNIKFDFVADSRRHKDINARINKLIDDFKNKADRFGLDYRISSIKELKFPADTRGGEPTLQKRATIYITKPRYVKAQATKPPVSKQPISETQKPIGETKLIEEAKKAKTPEEFWNAVKSPETYEKISGYTLSEGAKKAFGKIKPNEKSYTIEYTQKVVGKSKVPAHIIAKTPQEALSKLKKRINENNDVSKFMRGKIIKVEPAMESKYVGDWYKGKIDKQRLIAFYNQAIKQPVKKAINYYVELKRIEKKGGVK